MIGKVAADVGEGKQARKGRRAVSRARRLRNLGGCPVFGAAQRCGTTQGFQMPNECEQLTRALPPPLDIYPLVFATLALSIQKYVFSPC